MVDTADQQREVVLNLDGEVSPSEFLRGVKDFFALLRSVTKNVTGDPSGLDWNVSVRSGSNLIVARAFPAANNSFAEVYQTVNAVNSGVQSLAEGAVVAPMFFSEETLTIVRDLAQLAVGSHGLDNVELRVNGSSNRFDAQVVASVADVLGREYTAIGSVEGKLQTVTDRGGIKFVVYDSLHDRRVTCHIDSEERLEEAVKAFRKRVEVTGLVKYRKNGLPISVKVSRIRVLKTREELPPLDQIRGVFSRTHE